MHSIVKNAVALSKSRYESISNEPWYGLSPDDCREAIEASDDWPKMSSPEKYEILGSLSIRLATGYQPLGVIFMRSIRRAEKKRAKQPQTKPKALILSRDDFKCVYCGGTSGGLHLDHVLPRSQGGEDVAGNLLTACRNCNLYKSDSILSSLDTWLEFVRNKNALCKIEQNTVIKL